MTSRYLALILYNGRNSPHKPDGLITVLNFTTREQRLIFRAHRRAYWRESWSPNPPRLPHKQRSTEKHKIRKNTCITTGMFTCSELHNSNYKQVQNIVAQNAPPEASKKAVKIGYQHTSKGHQ